MMPCQSLSQAVNTWMLLRLLGGGCSCSGGRLARVLRGRRLLLLRLRGLPLRRLPRYPEGAVLCARDADALPLIFIEI